MVSSLPQRSDHLRVRYRALLLDAWGRTAAGAPTQAEAPVVRPGPRVGDASVIPSAATSRRG